MSTVIDEEGPASSPFAVHVVPKPPRCPGMERESIPSILPDRTEQEQLEALLYQIGT